MTCKRHRCLLMQIKAWDFISSALPLAKRILGKDLLLAPIHHLSLSPQLNNGIWLLLISSKSTCTWLTYNLQITNTDIPVCDLMGISTIWYYWPLIPSRNFLPSFWITSLLTSPHFLSLTPSVPVLSFFLLVWWYCLSCTYFREILIEI